MNPWLSLILGLIVLYFGAEALVKGGAGLALRLGLTPLVIGLTVVAFGTSSPELVVSVQAALRGEGAISVGNVVGSNIANLALILGCGALIFPLTTTAQVIRREVPIMIGTSVVAALFLWDRHVSRIEGGILLAGLVVYTVVTVVRARAEATGEAAREYREEFAAKPMPGGWAIVFGVGGLGGLVLGSSLFVDGAVKIATAWGMSPVIIGLTIVAVGTSLPELATTVVAALKKESDVAVGNVVGSNLFNLLGILGIAALLAPIDVPDLRMGDLIVMLLVSVAVLPLAMTGGRINRWEGAVLLAGYVAYTIWLIQRAQGAA